MPNDFEFETIELEGARIYLAEFDPEEELPPRLRKLLPSRNFGKRRQLEWYYGRSLLAKVCGNGLEWNEVELKGHSRLEGIQGYFSLSHTNGLCALAWCRKPAGLDVEKTGRQVPSGALDKFVSSGDEFGQESALERWCAKEACFKALAAARQNKSGPRSLKEVVIKQKNFFYHEHMGTFSFVDSKRFQTRKVPFLMALARLER